MAKNHRAFNPKRESFVWPVPDKKKEEKGFLWREDLQWADPSEEFRSRAYQLPPFLVQHPETKRRRYVSILEEAQDCFLRFARLAGPDTPRQREAIRRFADRYGLLTGGRWVAPAAGGEVEPGESLAFWRQEIQHMAWAVQVLGAMPDPKERIDDELLRRIVWWQRDRVGYVLTNLPREELLRFRDAEEVFEFIRGEYRRAVKGGTPEERHKALFSAGWLAGAGKRDRIFRRIPWGDLLRPAKLLLADLVAKKLAEYPVALRIGMDAERGELRSFPMPANLLSAMWFLVYRAIRGEVKIKRCSRCGEWGVMARSTWRKHPECENANRQRWHRLKPKILDLYGSGKSEKEIALLLGLPEEEVRKHLQRWLKNRKGVIKWETANVEAAPRGPSTSARTADGPLLLAWDTGRTGGANESPSTVGRRRRSKVNS